MKFEAVAACLSALAALSAQTRVRVDNPPSETSFTISSPDFTYPGTFSSIRNVDFKNLLFPIPGFDHSEVVQLKNGHYEYRGSFGEGFENVDLDSIRILGKSRESGNE